MTHLPVMRRSKRRISMWKLQIIGSNRYLDDKWWSIYNQRSFYLPDVCAYKTQYSHPYNGHTGRNKDLKANVATIDKIYISWNAMNSTFMWVILPKSNPSKKKKTPESIVIFRARYTTDYRNKLILELLKATKVPFLEHF